MFIEIRNIGKKKKYYLSHSYKENGKTKKIRRYLGENLSEKQIKKIKPQAEEILQERIKSLKKIPDPFQTVLSSSEIAKITTLVTKGNIKVKHLSEKEWKQFTDQFTFDTNAIEGSRVIKSEVKEILHHNKWPEHVGKNDISETYGVAKAIEYIRKTKTHISINLIKDIHKIVFKSSKSFAGKLRPRGVEVIVSDEKGNVIHRGAPSTIILSLLKELINWYNKNKKKYHPIVLAAVIHNQFESIHPFQDGNGRVGRILLNNILLKHNFPPLNIELKCRLEYYKTLQKYQQEGNLRPTIEFILKEYKQG